MLDFMTVFSRVLAMTLGLCLINCATRPPSRPCSADVHGCATRAYALRLQPGDDLRLKLVEFSRQHHLRAAYVVTCVGSLKVAAIRFADQPHATTVNGPLEIVSLVGTISPDGPHLHISVADTAGRTSGGHLTEGSLVYTTAEIVLGELTDATFSRAKDPITTYDELVIK